MNIFLGYFMRANPEATLSTNRIRGWHTFSVIFAFKRFAGKKSQRGNLKDGPMDAPAYDGDAHANDCGDEKDAQYDTSIKKNFQCGAIQAKISENNLRLWIDFNGRKRNHRKDDQSRNVKYPFCSNGGNAGGKRHLFVFLQNCGACKFSQSSRKNAVNHETDHHGVEGPPDPNFVARCQNKLPSQCSDKKANQNQNDGRERPEVINRLEIMQ